MTSESHCAARAIPGAFWKAWEGGGVNLREAIGEYAVRYAHCQEVLGMEGEGAERIRRQAGEAEERLYRVVKVAEAAMVIVEQQEAVDNYAFADVVGGRGELWEQYRVARAKAKEANQS